MFRRANLFYTGIGSQQISTFDSREKLADYDSRNNGESRFAARLKVTT